MLGTDSLAKQSRLSPATSLSGKTRETAHEVEKHTLPPQGPRVCAMCAIEDQTHAVDGEYDLSGRPKLEHLVTIELQFIKDRSQLTAYKMSRGWKYKFHQGRHAMERFICRPCLRAAEVMHRDWMRKCAKDSGTRKTNHDSYYGDLCG